MSQAATQMCGQRNILIQINSFKFSFTPTHIHVFCLNVFRNGAEAETAACTSDHQEEASRSRSHSSLAGFEHIPVTAASLLLSLRAHAGWAICRGSKILEIFSAETRKISLLLQQQQSALSKRRRWWTAQFDTVSHIHKNCGIYKKVSVKSFGLTGWIPMRLLLKVCKPTVIRVVFWLFLWALRCASLTRNTSFGWIIIYARSTAGF